MIPSELAVSGLTRSKLLSSTEILLLPSDLGLNVQTKKASFSFTAESVEPFVNKL